MEIIFLHIYVFGKEPKQLNYVLSLLNFVKKSGRVANDEYKLLLDLVKNKLELLLFSCE